MVALNKKSVAKNTLLLYARMVLLMLVTLYTSRVILNSLGIEDYGIYSAVGGFVGMLGIVTNSLTAAISRFITFELGKGKENRIRDVFVSSMYIEIILAIGVIIVLESVGVWFLNTYMTIPEDRIVAANYVLHFSIIAFAISLLNAPYNAVIIAHERMTAFAYIGIFQALGSLTVAMLIESSSIDRLIFYSLLICIVNVLIFFVYRVYSKRNFSDCRMKLKADSSIIKQIFTFAGWNFIGASSGVLRDQGINVLLNVFCGPAVNAARGISMQVSSAVSQFSTNFLTAINPQITKSYAANARDYMMSLVFQGARFTVYLLSLISIPVMFEANTILSIWLKIVPDYAVTFVRLVLLYQLVEAVSYTMVTMMLANGNIKKYQLIVGGCQMLNFPLSYIALKIGLTPEYTIIIAIVVAILCLYTRLYMLSQMEGLSIMFFFKHVVLNVTIVYLISSIVPFLITLYIPASNIRFLVVTFASVLTTLLSILYIGCTNSERKLIISKAYSIYGKIKNRH